ncbi:hypothetical protein EDC01DRAFT_648379 [Geopyxis carbonaria]|nr:hypothetical protein EDC01DRAFT_648379 [Geopyxis carbonaria]
MTCFNCTSRLLRTFIQDSATPFKVPGNWLIQPSISQRSLRNIVRQQHRQSSTDTAIEHATEDEYIPFVVNPIDAGNRRSAHQREIHQPPIPRIKERGPAQEAIRNPAKDISSVKPPLDAPGASKPPLGNLQSTDGKTVKSRATPKRPKTWNLPPIEAVIPKKIVPHLEKLKNDVKKTPRQEVPRWKIEKVASKQKFPQWMPEKRVSPEAIEGIRSLHKQYPDKFPTPKLSQLFNISVEAIQRILKSKWKPNAKELKKRAENWEKRGGAIWQNNIEMGEVQTKLMKKTATLERRKREELGKTFVDTKKRYEQEVSTPFLGDIRNRML